MTELRSYNDVINENKGEYINYNTLLNTIEWNSKSKEIKERDNHTCQKCKKSIKPISKKDVIFKGLYGAKIRIKESHENVIISTEILDHLEVHHTYYIKNLLPWEYDDALITVCSKCHEKIHQNEFIDVYYLDNDHKLNLSSHSTPCDRCNGKGYIKGYSYVQGGICFKCRGNKVVIYYSKQI